MQKTTIAIVSIIIVAGIIAGVWWLQRANNTQQNKEPTQISNNESTDFPDKKQTQISSDVPNDISSSWQTYNNEAYGFQLSYPITWDMNSGNLDKYSPIFNVQGQTLSFDVGILNNQKKLTIEQWVDQNNFFSLKQYEDTTTYVAHGILDPIDIVTKSNIKVPVYFGRASGGGSTGTAIISSGEKMIVVAYSLPNSKEFEATKEVFKNVIKTFKFSN